MPTLELLQTINAEDASVAAAVRLALPEVARLVDETVERLIQGGRVHYFGAGTSGRLGFLDAVELPPTYGVEFGLFEAHLAGGLGALVKAVEGAEDDPAIGAEEADALGPADVAVGIAASGYTPFVQGALERAGHNGAFTALVTSNPQSPLLAGVQLGICVDTGAEVITGSTRMKSASAQKMVLNAFSTAVMVKSGRTWSNLMVALMPTNNKLRGRAVRMLSQATGYDLPYVARVLDECGDEAKTALVMILAQVPADQARQALAANRGIVAHAITAIKPA